MQLKRLLLAAVTLAVVALFVEPVAAETAVNTVIPPCDYLPFCPSPPEPPITIPEPPVIPEPPTPPFLPVGS